MKELTLFSLFFFSFHLLSAQNAYSNDKGVALNGYDVIAYHQQYQAVRGSKAHSTNYQGATYYFSSEDNKSAFLKAPTNYLPKYGGFCAFAMAMKNAKVPSDPTTFKIHNGSLYLFFNDYYEGQPFNTIVPWNQQEASLIAKANGNWKKK